MSRDIPGIEVRPATSGDTAYIRQTRIPVWLLEEAWQIGETDAGLLSNYPTLTPDDLDNARAYVQAHPDEIAQAIRENQEA